MDWTQQPVDSCNHCNPPSIRVPCFLPRMHLRCPDLRAIAMPRILCSSRTPAACTFTLTSRHAAGNSRAPNTSLLSLSSKANLSAHCTALQLFLLFLVHAYGARTWRKPSESSRRLFAPAEAAFQPPEGQSKLVMDGPWRLLWPCLVPWALMQAAHSVAWLRNATASGEDRSATSVLSISIGMGTFRV